MSAKKQLILYVVFGILTTIVNIVTYCLCTYVLHIDYKVSTTIAWIVSVLFAFVTNKLYVFQSADRNAWIVIKEMVLFFVARLFSYILDIGAMILFVETLMVNDFIAKCAANVLVIVVNYFASKYVIFKRVGNES